MDYLRNFTGETPNKTKLYNDRRDKLIKWGNMTKIQRDAEKLIKQL